MKDQEIQHLINNYRRDLEAYSTAKAILMNYIADLESDPNHHSDFVNWAGTQVVMNGLILCEVKARGIIEDLQNNMKSEAQVLKLVRS